MESGRVVPLHPHYCPACGRPMAFVSSVPKFASFPELRTFACKSCGITFTEAAKDAAKPVDNSSEG